MSPAIEEILYPALEDYELDIVIGQGPSARSVKMPLQKFTLIGATTRDRAADLAAALALRHRAPARVLRARPISRRSSGGRRGFSACRSTTRRRPRSRGASRGTPRIANRLLRRVRDYAQVRADGTITLDVAHAGAEAARGRRARLRRSRSQAAADDHRQVRRRPGRPQHDRRGDQRREGRDRGHLRAVPDPDRLSRSHAARPRRDAARLRLLRARRRRGRDSRLW